MTEMAAALYVKQTGHVLGVVTRTGDPAGTPTAASLAGTAFPVLKEATGDVLVEIEPTELDVLTVPLIDDLLLRPQRCVVDTTASEAHATSGTAPTVVLTSASLSVKLVAAAADKTKVWAQAESGSGSNRQRHVFSAELAQGEQQADFASTFAPGDWDILGLAAGAPPVADTKTV